MAEPTIVVEGDQTTVNNPVTGTQAPTSDIVEGAKSPVGIIIIGIALLVLMYLFTHEKKKS
jgi:hypothetical protein